jgi:hypothetical protein
VLGREELDRLALQKQALVLESGLNRLALQAEIQGLRSATAWVGKATNASRTLAPLLAVLASMAGFLFARGSRRSASWPSRIVGLAKWVLPLYRLWKDMAADRRTAAQGREPEV